LPYSCCVKQSILQEVGVVVETDASAGQALLRSLEAIGRAMRESAFEMARDLPCSRGSVPVVRLLAQRGPLQVGEIADALHVDISVASRQVSHLVAQGYARRTEHDQDRRVRTLSLTPAGDTLAAHLQAAVGRRTAHVFADWTAPELEAAVATLDHIAQSIESQPRTRRTSTPHEKDS
jgi:DNA-binding MarR family transcriptional regulator